ncbi:MAG TPA: 6,7-dimethyl-8-ribityllumazine synthase [Candidatus Diapherotrites archaeon]|nr:6,7-dimethyl-8-ribityllumazine synthase [Candidatus Diapherotrites archaeon]
MLRTAEQHAASLGCTLSQVLHVPGAYDLPLAVKKLLQRRDVDAVVTLGAVIAGETGHDEVILSALAPALTQLSLEFMKPVALGVIGPATEAQAEARAEEYPKRAVEAAVQMLAALR